jgi:DNA-binding transcriptional regulator WhiA
LNIGAGKSMRIDINQIAEDFLEVLTMIRLEYPDMSLQEAQKAVAIIWKVAGEKGGNVS